MAQASTKVVHLASHKRGRGAKAPSYRLDPAEKLARIIFQAIETDLHSADFFTREDLLQLRVLQSVATITRYHMVCKSVHWLINSRRLTALSRTELCLTGYVTGARKVSGPNLIEQYQPTVRRLITRYSSDRGGAFDTMDLLEMWTTDPHLTTNAKRVVIRSTLKALRRDMTLRDGPRHMSFLAQGD
jgi:hypothetical protein